MSLASSAPTKTGPQTVAADLLDQMARIRRVLRRHQQRPEELTRLTGAQLELVRLVRRTPGITVAHAAAELGVAPNTVSTLVSQLTGTGALVRTADKSDRRIARLALAKRLAGRLVAWRDRREVALADALSNLTPDEQATVAEATTLLQRVADELERSA